MRLTFLLIALSALLAASASLSSESITYIWTQSDQLLPADSAYLQAIAGVKQRIVVSVVHAKGGAPVAIPVSYVGPLDPRDLMPFLQALLADPKSGTDTESKLVVSVKGDKHRLSILIGTSCGLLCGGSVSHLFTNENGRWRYLYSYDHLVS